MSSQAALPARETLTGEPSREEGGVLGQVGLNTHLFGAQLLNFAIVLFVVVRFVVRPLQRQLAERTARIEEGLRQAKEADERLARAVEEQAALLAQARREAAGIVDEARVRAGAEQDAYLARTKAEVARLVESGKAQLASDRDMALRDAKAQLGAIVVAAAEKIAGQALDQNTARAQAASAIEDAYAQA